MVKIYIEGGGESRALKIELVKGFTGLLENCGFGGRKPRLVRGGGREQTYRKFKIACESVSTNDIVLLLVDSEDPVADINRTWNHLRQRDNWQRPRGSKDEDVLLMTTCMETWIAADPKTLNQHYGQRLQESALPSLNNLENQNRRDVLRKLEHATRCCIAPYSKGPTSFAVLGKLNPDVLEQYLPSFKRARSILDSTLSSRRHISSH